MLHPNFALGLLQGEDQRQEGCFVLGVIEGDFLGAVNASIAVEMLN